MRNNSLIFFFILFYSITMAPQEHILITIFWNVGQGQWITTVTPDECIHFDFGGEFQTLKRNKNVLLKLCQRKTNILYLSHADLDHYNFYNYLVQTFPKICWAEPDHANLPAKKIKRPIPLCASSATIDVQRLANPTQFKNKNESSKVYRVNNILIPGDSPSQQEKKWSQNLATTQSIHFLSLGHHGSRTSTSEHLLNKLPRLKLAVVQARFKKYKHPHPQTLLRLKKYRVPVLKTEDWGNVFILQ